MSDISLKSLLEAGVHFGHQVSRWNPKMKPYLYMARNGIHIIDLEQTIPLLHKAYQFVLDQVARGGSVLFVGTKPQAQEVVVQEAQRAGMFYVTHRWLGGMLTNFKTIKQSINKLKDYYVRKESGELARLVKREQLQLERQAEKMECSLGGIRDLDGLPTVVIVVDPNRECIALRESKRLGIPVVALADSNCNPDEIDFLIPGNDDAMRSIQLVVTFLADACVVGMERRQVVIQKQREAKEDPKAGTPRQEERQVGGRGRAYVAERPAPRGGRRKGKGPEAPTAAAAAVAADGEEAATETEAATTLHAASGGGTV